MLRVIKTINWIWFYNSHSNRKRCGKNQTIDKGHHGTQAKKISTRFHQQEAPGVVIGYSSQNKLSSSFKKRQETGFKKVTRSCSRRDSSSHEPSSVQHSTKEHGIPCKPSILKSYTQASQTIYTICLPFRIPASSMASFAISSATSSLVCLNACKPLWSAV